ncbi:MAG: thioredoxin [Candidatus Thermoplasmatota archaeon]|nr:thioredoxin [Candidatus Thermoplasmatota archaeon]MCL5989930.1 thioredoxin [Candidatus Thermoplasmatota archaeon]
MDDNIDMIRQKMMREIMERQNNKQASQNNGKPKVLTDQNFASEIANNDVVVVDFWAEWCQPCRFVSPIVEELARDYSGKAAFGKLNVDENPLVSNQFMIRSIPTIMFFKKGRLVDSQIGAVPRGVLEAKLRKYL